MNIYTTDKIRNVVLLGHGGCGKTSLVEAMAYVSGLTTRIGKVTDGNTISDYDKEEIKRKFSITTSVVPLIWQGCKINLLDAPGYFDFVGEAEEAVSAADAAIIDAMRPVFVIGSEVPIPGGAQEAEDTLAVTSPDAFRDTVATYRRVFKEEGIEDGMNDVIAVVVQPGVEFGDDQVFLYNHDAAVDLCAALKEYPEVCFEGHSADYQSPQTLRDMCQDGIAILKVGPALTYGLREALFALSFMEKELVPEAEQAHFIETLEEVMLKNPANWQKHYHGDDKQLALARKYSFSDRARYYIGQPEVTEAMDKLFENLRKYQIPMNMLHQYMPVSYNKVRDGELELDPRELAMDGVTNFMMDYEYAVAL